MWYGFTALQSGLRKRAGAAIVALLFTVCAGPALAANPVQSDAASVARGAQLFQQFCTECHGRDGRAQVDVISDATDLTEPEAYYSGAGQDDIFNSISNGAGVAMPAWQTQIADPTDIWHLVNFIRSLWTPEQRAGF